MIIASKGRLECLYLVSGNGLKNFTRCSPKKQRARWRKLMNRRSMAGNPGIKNHVLRKEFLKRNSI
jgi:hypothetical protein